MINTQQPANIVTQ